MGPRMKSLPGQGCDGGLRNGSYRAYERRSLIHRSLQRQYLAKVAIER